MLSPEQKEQFTRDGYVVVRGLIPEDVVRTTRENLLNDLGVVLDDPATWKSKAETTRWAWGDPAPCMHSMRSGTAPEP